MNLVEYTPVEYDDLFSRLHIYFKEENQDLDDDSLAYFLFAEYRAEIERLMDPTQSQTLVRAMKLVDDNQVIGFALYVNYAYSNPNSDGELFIMEFYIDPKLRGKGYGKRFYEMIETLEKTRGAKYSQLTADRAVGFWQKVGFVDTGIVEDNGCNKYRKDY